MCGLAVCLAWGRVEAAEPGLPVREQILELQEGWNAIFLEVEPADPDPGRVFGELPVDIVASFYARVASAQFVTDPGANLFRRAGWGVWYADDRPDAFLGTLHAIHGQRAYLIHATAAFTWRIQGEVVAEDVVWQSRAFNLVGFSVRPTGAPTFAEFFAGSRAHRHNRIYRLAQGSWRRVTDPASETLRSGEAFWIYCDGVSTYQGPLRVGTRLQRSLILGTGTAALTLRNETRHPVAPTLELIAGADEAVPLSLVIQAVGDGENLVRRVAAPLPSGPWVQELPALDAGRAVRVPFEVRREAMGARRQTSVLKISTDMGTEHWLPVISVRDDLEER